MKHLDYNEETLKKVSDLIMKNLTFDLLPKGWMMRNFSNPTFGHCHNASGCLYKIFGSKNVHMYRGFDGEIYHWWIVDKNGRRIDLTSEQYTSIGKIPPYDVGEKSGLLGYDYKKRVLELLKRVTAQLENKDE